MHITILVTASLASIAAAASCAGREDVIENNDITHIATAIQNNEYNWSWPKKFEAWKGKAIHHSSVVACVRNVNPIYDMDVEQQWLVDAINDVAQQCGAKGGTYDMRDSSGTITRVSIEPYEEGSMEDGTVCE